MKIGAYRIALACSVKDFIWPVGYVPDTDATVAHISHQDGNFQTGMEHVGLSISNNCAWEQTWFDARKSGNAASEAKALDMLTNYVPFYTTRVPHMPSDAFDAGVIHFEKDAAAKAALGDASMIELDLNSSCVNMHWKTKP